MSKTNSNENPNSGGQASTGSDSTQAVAQDSIFGAQNVSSNAALSKNIDPITQAVRDEVLAKQSGILRDWMVNNTTFENEEEKDKIKALKDKELREYLNKNNEKVKDALENSDVQKKLHEAERAGYQAIGEKFKDVVRTIDWQATDKENVRSFDVKNADGKVIATLSEEAVKSPTTLVNSKGEQVNIEDYRKIDFPTKLNEGAEGPMHVQIAVKDASGKNIAEDKAVYFTAHYDKTGNLTEVSSPMPVKFMGKGNDAIGFIERDGQIYTLPVTQGKYNEMLQEVAKNQGHAMDLSQQKDLPKQMGQLAQDKIQQQTDQPAHDKTNSQLNPKHNNKDVTRPSVEQISEILSKRKLSPEDQQRVKASLEAYNLDNKRPDSKTPPSDKVVIGHDPDTGLPLPPNKVSFVTIPSSKDKDTQQQNVQNKVSSPLNLKQEDQVKEFHLKFDPPPNNKPSVAVSQNEASLTPINKDWILISKVQETGSKKQLSHEEQRQMKDKGEGLALKIQNIQKKNEVKWVNATPSEEAIKERSRQINQNPNQVYDLNPGDTLKINDKGVGTIESVKTQNKNSPPDSKIETAHQAEQIKQNLIRRNSLTSLSKASDLQNKTAEKNRPRSQSLGGTPQNKSNGFTLPPRR